jgi:TolB-like protein/Tfp pilus assembly protein PilF
MYDLIPRTVRFIRELRRRRVIRNTLAYLALSLVIIEAGGNVLPPLGFPETSVRLVILACVAGFPLVVALSWIYDIAEGRLVRTESEEPRGAEASPGGGGTGVAARSGAGTMHRTRHDRRRVVVLPFQNLSRGEDTYLSDGIVDDLTATLAAIPSLRVTSRTSARVYGGRGLTTVEIGQELGVGSVLEGTVRRSGERVRIVTRLVDAFEDRPVWAETYDRELEDILAVQSDVARHIAEALEAELSDRSRDRLARVPTVDTTAYDAYLKGRFLWGQRTEGGLEASLDHLRAAVAADPDFALAHAALADSLLTLGLYGIREPAGVMPRARDAARSALELDPGNGEARAALACVRAIWEWDWTDAEARFGEAIQARPSYATARQWLAMHVLAPLGRFEPALARLDEARDLDPAAPAIQASRAFLLILRRRYAEAEELCRGILTSHPGFALAHLFLGEVLLQAARPDEAVVALQAARQLRPRAPDVVVALARASAAAGDDTQAEAGAEAVEALARERYVSPGRRAQLAAALGRTEEASRHLDRALEVRAVELVWLRVSPAWDDLRGEPSYGRALRRMGLPDPEDEGGDAPEPP